MPSALETFDCEGFIPVGEVRCMPVRRWVLSLPRYHVDHFAQLDWSDYPGAVGGLQGAVEMELDHGACRRVSKAAPCARPIASRMTSSM